MASIPGFYAYPGVMTPGYIQPGMPYRASSAPVNVLAFSTGTPVLAWITGTPYLGWHTGTPST